MSRTYHHTTPAFPRSLRGPRVGQIVAPTPCSECVAFDVCRPGACNAPFGCDSWVDHDGRRVDAEADDARLLAIEEDRFQDSAFDPDPTPCLECGGLPSECRPCGCPHVERDPGPLFKR